MSQFSFPVLENDDLLPCLEEMEVCLEASALAKPTYEVVRPVMERLVISLTGITREDLTQPSFTALDAFEYPELHDESIPTNNLVRKTSDLMATCGVKDFSLKDIFKPEPMRLRRHLSAVVNFAKFREEKLNTFQAYEESIAQRAEETQQEEAAYEALKAELHKAHAARSSQKAEVVDLTEQRDAVVAHNQQLNQQQVALQAEARSLQKEVNQLTDQASQAKMDLLDLSRDIEQYRDQIVQSPDKHRQAIAELVASADGRRAYLAQMSSTSHDNQQRLDAIARCDKDLRRCIKLLNDLEYEVGRKKEASQTVKDMQEAISEDEMRLQEVGTSLAALRRQASSFGEKFTKLEAQVSLKMEVALSQVREETKVKEAIEADNARDAAHAAKGEAQVRSLRDATTQLEADLKAQVRTALERYSMLRKVVGDYNRRLEAALKPLLVASKQP